MNRITVLLPALLAAGTLQAQSYNYNRNSGKVTVDNKTVFYLVKTSGTLGYAVRNAGGQELIQVSNGEMDKEGRGDVPGYKFTFTASGNFCSFIPASLGFSAPKLIISTVLRNKLVAADTITASSERNFVLSNKGHYNGPAAPQVVADAGTKTPAAQMPPAPAPTAPAPAGTVRIEGDKAYVGNRLVATFRDDTQGPVRTLHIYGTDDVVVAKATRSLIEQSDWTVALPAEKTSLQLRFYSDRSVERLIDFLLSKSYLR